MGILVTLLAVFFIGPITTDVSVSQDNASVRGIVIDPRDHQPISGVTVYANSYADVQQVTTDERGQFFFLTLLPSDYSFHAVKAGYDEDCIWVTERAYELDAGSEYDATLLLPKACH